MLTPPAAAKTSRFLTEYALEKNIYMKINYFNPEHVHTLIDLPTNTSIEEVVQLFKGRSSHLDKREPTTAGKIFLGVSHSHAEQVAAYIANQAEHHRKKTFTQEFELFVKKYGLEWFEDRNR